MTEEFSEEVTAQIERIIEEGENDYPAEEAAREIEKNNYHTRFPKYYSYSEWAMRNFPIQYYNEKLLLKELVSDITSSISFLLYSMYSEYLKNKEGVIANTIVEMITRNKAEILSYYLKKNAWREAIKLAETPGTPINNAMTLIKAAEGKKTILIQNFNGTASRYETASLPRLFSNDLSEINSFMSATYRGRVIWESIFNEDG